MATKKSAPKQSASAKRAAAQPTDAVEVTADADEQSMVNAAANAAAAAESMTPAQPASDA